MFNSSDDNSFGIMENCTRIGKKPIKISDIFNQDFEGLWLLLGIPGITLAIGAFLLMVKCLRRTQNSSEYNANDFEMEISSRPSTYKTEIKIVVNPEQETSNL